VGKDESVSITGARTLTVGKSDTVEVTDDRSLSVGKGLKETVGKSAERQVSDNWTVNVGKKFALSADSEIALKCGSAQLVMKSDGKIEIKGSGINIKASGDVIIKGSKVAAN
jgi:type VI secretion system secreted protein VgrG